MILNNLFPVFALILVGGLLKSFRLTTDRFLEVCDRLVYFIFFPALLFWKIGGAPNDLFDQTGLYKAVIGAVLAIYLLSTACIFLANVQHFKAGSFSQSCYRFNTYIGVAIVMNAFGEDGIRQFGILIGIIIPIINVLAVSTLTWFGGRKKAVRQRAVQTLGALVTNPLILACLGGILYGRLINRFPVFIDNTLRLASYVTLPLALLSIGGALTLKSLKENLGLSLAAAGFKLLLLPLIGYGFLKWFQVTGLPFNVGMLFFCLPTSTALYVLSSQLDSDTRLASASIALSTILSFVPLSIALLLRS
jgi:hypothetical protein